MFSEDSSAGRIVEKLLWVVWRHLDMLYRSEDQPTSHASLESKPNLRSLLSPTTRHLIPCLSSAEAAEEESDMLTCPNYPILSRSLLRNSLGTAPDGLKVTAFALAPGELAHSVALTFPVLSLFLSAREQTTVIPINVCTYI